MSGKSRKIRSIAMPPMAARSLAAWVLAVVIAMLAAMACSSATSTSADVESSAVAGPTITASPSQSPSDQPAPEKPQRVERPRHVRAHILSGSLVRVRWNARERDVRSFQVYDYFRAVSKHVPSDQRQADVYASYGTHCFRVKAVAKHGALDVGPVGCGMVSVTAGPVPAIVGTWYRVGEGELDDPPTPVDGPMLVVYADGTYRELGSNDKGFWWVGSGEYQMLSCPQRASPANILQLCADQNGSVEGSELTVSCCSTQQIYRRI